MAYRARLLLPFLEGRGRGGSAGFCHSTFGHAEADPPPAPPFQGGGPRGSAVGVYFGGDCDRSGGRFATDWGRRLSDGAAWRIARLFCSPPWKGGVGGGSVGFCHSTSGYAEADPPPAPPFQGGGLEVSVIGGRFGGDGDRCGGGCGRRGGGELILPGTGRGTSGAGGGGSPRAYRFVIATGTLVESPLHPSAK